MKPKLTPRLGLGLRAQIILALCAVYAISLLLLGMTAVQLTRRAAEVDREQTARILIRALAISIETQENFSEESLHTLARRLLKNYPKSTIRYITKSQDIYHYGEVSSHEGIEEELSNGARLKLWISKSKSTRSSPLTNLLLFYLTLTGGVVVLLTYVALTYSIVRPIERLIRSSERLAAGSPEVCVPVKGASEVMRMAVAFNKMAEQLRRERQALEQRLQQLEHTTDELQSAQQQIVQGEKLATVGRLAAGVAHEIGNPLAAILGLVQLLEAGGLQATENEEFLKRIRLETERISKIIRDLLNFSRRGVESEDLNVTSDITRVVSDAVNLVKPLKELRNVKIDISCADNLPRVVGPQHKLTQVILNLLLNSSDALNGEGQITIEIHHLEPQSNVKVVISDTGPGIAPEVMDRIFEPFTTTKPAGKGTGLGLAVCHTLVEAVGGSISATNLQQSGARFEIQLSTVE